MSDLYIDGAWLAPVRPAALEVVNPYDASVLQTVEVAGSAEVALAVEAAGLEEYREPKHIYQNLAPKPSGWFRGIQ